MAKEKTAIQAFVEGAPFDRSAPVLLKKDFPMTYRRAFKKSFWRFTLLAAIVALWGSCEVMWVGQIGDENLKFNVRCVFGGLTLAAFAWWIARLVYYEIERRFYDYRVVGGNLYLSKGMFVKETGSFPLSRITDIYLHRGWGDYFWGLSSLHVSTPTTTSGQFAFIHGLTTRSAVRLRRRLEQLVKESDHHIENISGLMGSVAAMQTQVQSDQKAISDRQAAEQSAQIAAAEKAVIPEKLASIPDQQVANS